MTKATLIRTAALTALIATTSLSRIVPAIVRSSPFSAATDPESANPSSSAKFFEPPFRSIPRFSRRLISRSRSDVSSALISSRFTVFTSRRPGIADSVACANWSHPGRDAVRRRLERASKRRKVKRSASVDQCAASKTSNDVTGRSSREATSEFVTSWS